MILWSYFVNVLQSSVVQMNYSELARVQNINLIVSCVTLCTTAIYITICDLNLEKYFINQISPKTLAWSRHVFCTTLNVSPDESWFMQLMVLWLILMSVSSDLSFHYNSITAPFTGLRSFYSGPRGHKGHGANLYIINIILKEQYSINNSSA